MVQEAASQGQVEVVVLPEMFAHRGARAGLLKAKSSLQEGVFKFLASLAQKHKITLVGGSHLEAWPGMEDHGFNTCVVYDSQGSVISTYRKLHLFNLLDAEGKHLYCESDVLIPGTLADPYTVAPSQGDSWQALTAICYDIRFPEFMRVHKQPFDILFVPAAFTWQTGQDHWEILLRARAIENQCYVVACGQTGYYKDESGALTKRNYGHSLVIDPWGKVVASLDEECGILYASLDKKVLHDVRARLPALADRKVFFN
jgi:nitrilase